MSEPSERLYAVSSHLRGGVLLAVFGFAPWLVAQQVRYTLVRLLAVYASATIETLQASMGLRDQNVLVNAIHFRRCAIAYGLMAAGALVLAFAPRRFARALIVAATAVSAGVASIFAHSVVLTVAENLALVTDENARAWWVGADIVACTPFLAVMAACLLAVRWSEWCLWPGGALCITNVSLLVAARRSMPPC